MKRTLTALAVITFIATPAMADEENRIWEAKAGLGFTHSSGNTNNTSFKTDLDVIQHLESWDINYNVNAYKQKDDNGTSADKKHFEVNGHYKLMTPNSSLYALAKRDEDAFGTFAESNTVSFGYGQNLYESKDVMLMGNIGPGYTIYEKRQDNTIVDGDSSIIHMDAKLTWQISENADFVQKLVVDKQLSDDKNTHVTLLSSLGAKINGSLRMTLEFKFDHNSVVSNGSKKNDTVTSVNLVYAF